MADLFRVVDDRLRLNFHPGQTKTWESQARFIFMLAGTQSGKCLALGTMVLLSNGGYKPIEAIVPGDQVLSLGTDLKIRPNRVSASFSTGIQPTYRITTSSGKSVVLTSEHPLYSPGGWLPAGKFHVGDFIGVPRQVGSLGQIGADIAHSDIYWDTVSSIEPLGDGPVWDITVEDGHNFIAEGIFCHNTSFGPWWLWREIYGYAGYPGCGSGDYLAVTSNFGLFKLKLLPELRYVFERVLGIGRYWSGDKLIELRNPDTGEFEAETSSDPMWGRIILRSAAAGGGLESATAKGAWLDEAGQDEFQLESWEAILRRLALNEGRVLGTTTPYNLGWVKTQVYDEWAKGNMDFDVIQFASILNPLFPKREFRRAQRTMPGWKFAMFYKGEFARPPGLIYGDYYEDIHKIPPFPIPPHWPRYVGIDPGGTNMSTVWVAENPTTHVFYLYRETLEGGITTDEHVEKGKARAIGENVVIWVGGAQSESQFRRDWISRGISVKEPKVWEVWSGIDNIIALFRTKRLFIFETCTGIRSQLGTYSRVLDKKTLEPTDEIKDKNSYHYLDALRYAGTRLITPNWGDAGEGDTADNMWNLDGKPKPTAHSAEWWR